MRQDNVLDLQIEEFVDEIRDFEPDLAASPGDLPTPDFIVKSGEVKFPAVEMMDGTETPGPNSKYPSARWWIGTSYKDIEESMKDDDALVVLYFQNLRHSLKARAIIGQIEKCPTSGRLHAQYAVRFNSTIRRSALKKRRPEDHFEIVRNRDASIKYCCKEASRYSHIFVRDGDIPLPNTSEPTTKIDWDNVLHAAQQGHYEEIPSRIYIQYYSSLTKIHEKCQQRVAVSDSVRGLWLHGKPGLGKTRFVFSQYDHEIENNGCSVSTLYLKSLDKWWDGFKNKTHQVVFMDEVSPAHKNALADSLKVWSDAMSFQADVKGSKMVPVYSKFIVASNYTISEFAAGDLSLEKALNRRYLTVTWVEKGLLVGRTPFPLFHSSEDGYVVYDRIDVKGCIEMAADFALAYRRFAVESAEKGFARPVSVAFISGLGTTEEVYFAIKGNGTVKILDKELVSDMTELKKQLLMLN